MLIIIRVLKVFLLIPALLVYDETTAACLGLGLPAPQTTNVCERLTEKLIIPQTKVFCDLELKERIAFPHCNLPGACHVDPTCKSFEVTKELASLIYNAGDLYCDFREVDPEKIIENLANNAYTDGVKLTTGGASSVLYGVASHHLDIIECAATALTPSLKSVIKKLVSSYQGSRNKYFYPIDIDRVRIISKSTTPANIYLNKGYEAITLDSVVILQNHKYSILSKWSYSWKDVLNGRLCPDELGALITMIHELVQVRQYRNIGREQFVNRYLAEALVNGYSGISTEKEASSFEEWAQKEYDTITNNKAKFNSSTFYRISAVHSRKVLDVSLYGRGGKKNGDNVHQWDWHGGDNQRWKIEDIGNGYFKITAKHSNKVLEVNLKGRVDGDNVQQWAWAGGNNQKWRIEKCDGFYMITAMHSKKVLDVKLYERGGKNNGDNIYQWASHGGNNQKWVIEDARMIDLRRVFDGVERAPLIRDPAERDYDFNR